MLHVVCGDMRKNIRRTSDPSLVRTLYICILHTQDTKPRASMQCQNGHLFLHCWEGPTRTPITVAPQHNNHVTSSQRYIASIGEGASECAVVLTESIA